MRELLPDLINSLNASATTFCTAWKLELKDGRVFGFSEHDRDLEIDGVSYLAQSSLTESESETRLGFAADNGALQGVLETVQISEADIAAGVLQGAKLSRFFVNWAKPSEYLLLDIGELGQVTTQGDVYVVEWLGLSARLGRSTGRVFSKKCDAQFADNRCGLSKGDFPEGTNCPKTAQACQAQFNNIANFRGFPYLLGDDALYAAPQIGERKDGGSRYS